MEEKIKYETLLGIVTVASNSQRLKGYVNLDEVLETYPDLLGKLFEDKNYFIDFYVNIKQNTGQIPNFFSNILTPLENLRIEDIDKFKPYRAKILSCKRKFIKNGSEVVEEFTGVVDVGGEKYRFIATCTLPMDECVIWAVPTLKESKNSFEVIFKIYGCQELLRDVGLVSISSVDFIGLNDVREVFMKIIGEDVNVALSILSLASRLNKQKDFWIMGIVIQGRSSAGKSYFMQNVLKPFTKMGRVEEFTRFTGAYLERKFAKLNKNMDDVILAIYELFADTPEQLHLTLSEGKLRVGIIDKETGEPIEFVFEGMPFLFSTTPFEALRPDIRNRIINISIDESDEQTKKIIEFETMLAKDPQKAIKLDEVEEIKIQQFVKFYEGLEKKYVIVPYAEVFLKILNFYDVKLRRDWKKLFSLLHASTLLFQKHRPKIKLPNGEEAVVATVEDFDNLLYVMPAFSETLVNLSKPQKMLIDIMAEEKQDEYTKKELTILANKRGWKVSQRRIHDVLNELEALGYVTVDDSGRSHKYSLLKRYSNLELTVLREEVKSIVENFINNHAVIKPKDLNKMEELEPTWNPNENSIFPGSEAQKNETHHVVEVEGGIDTLSQEMIGEEKNLNNSLDNDSTNQEENLNRSSSKYAENLINNDKVENRPVSQVPLPQDHEFSDSTAQRGGKPENRKSSRKVPELPNYLNLSEGGDL